MLERNLKIGLALGCGGARGLAHIGILKALEKESIKIDYIAGVSMGSLIASCYALGIDLEYLETEALKFDKRSALRRITDFSTFRRSVIKGKKIYKYIHDLVGDNEFSDCKIPLEIIAADLISGEEMVFKNGHLVRAIQASISVPGIFPPVKYEDKYLVDGGALNSVPINRVEEMGADIIIGVDLLSRGLVGKIEMENPSMITTLLRAYEIMRYQPVRIEYEKEESKYLLIKPKFSKLDSFKFHEVEKFIKSGEEAVAEIMPLLKSKIEKYKI